MFGDFDPRVYFHDSRWTFRARLHFNGGSRMLAHQHAVRRFRSCAFARIEPDACRAGTTKCLDIQVSRPRLLAGPAVGRVEDTAKETAFGGLLVPYRNRVGDAGGREFGEKADSRAVRRIRRSIQARRVSARP